MPEPVRTAVVTGGHPYDVPAFTALFRGMTGVDAYVQHMEDFATDPAGRRDWYDAVLFYHILQKTPDGTGPWFEETWLSALERLGKTRQGIVVLHHALLAFPDWPLWHHLVGIPDYAFRDYHLNQSVRIAPAGPGHPITRGLSAWEMTDETYEMAEPGADSEILLTIAHPKSMRACGWARQYGEARVFCLQSGHDAAAFGCPSFATVLERGILWCAHRL